MPDRIAPQNLPAILRGAGLVYVAGCAGQSPVLSAALQAAGDALAGIEFTGVWIPGVNRIDYASLHPTACSRLFFLSPDYRAGFEAGRARYLPLPYTRIYPLLESWDYDAALLHLSPPDADGNCSLGVAADFTPAILSRARRRIAHIDPSMPTTRGAATIAYEDLDAVIEEDAPLLTFDVGGLDADFVEIGRNVARLVRDGDVLQLGLGKMQGAVLRALDAHRGLRIHSGMITDPVLALLDAGAIEDGVGTVTTGVALGSRDLYDRAATDACFRFASVADTHDIRVLATLDGLVAINSTIEIDLMGQCNAETLGSRQISGAGGLVDFLRGARLAKNGRGVVALASTARQGTVSRIVSRLSDGAPVSIARGDVDLVVTEHGIADLRGCDLEARAAALIEIAAPGFREGLAREWRVLRSAM